MKRLYFFLAASFFVVSFSQGQIPVFTKTAFKPPSLNPLQNYYKQRLAKSFELGEALKSTAAMGTTSKTEVGLSSTTTINRSPLYTEPVKTETPITTNSPACAPFRVNFKQSNVDFSVDAGSNSQLRDLVYPGSLVNATNLLNGNYSDGLSTPLPAFPMNLSTSMLPLQANQTSTRLINAISAANVKNALNDLYLQNAQGGTNSPSIQFVEAYMLESNNQWRAESKHTWDLDISRSLSVPIEVINVTAGGGASGSVSVSGLLALQKQTSYAVLVFKHIYYSASIEPVQPAGTAGGSGRYFNTAAGNIPDDLLYIKTVDYGRVVYVVISANASREELAFALNRKFGANIDLGLGLAGSDLGISGSDNASYSDEMKINKVFQGSNISYKVFFYGGNPVPPRDLVISANEVMNAPDGSASVLVNKILSNVSTNYSNNNVPLPIGFSCRFAKDGTTAWANSNINYYSESCSPTIKYDLDLELDNIEFITINSGVFGDREELYGDIKFTYLGTGSREVNTDKKFWDKSEGATSFSLGKHQVDKRETIIRNLTYEELTHTRLYVAGELYDDEGIMGSRVYKCNNCQDFSGNQGKRRFYFNETASLLTSVNQLLLNGEYQVLKIGGDNFLELDFYESDRRNEGFVKINWKIWIKPHQ